MNATTDILEDFQSDPDMLALEVANLRAELETVNCHVEQVTAEREAANSQALAAARLVKTYEGRLDETQAALLDAERDNQRLRDLLGQQSWAKRAAEIRAERLEALLAEEAGPSAFGQIIDTQLSNLGDDVS